MTDLPRIGQLEAEQLRDCPPELYGDHAFQASSLGFIPDPAYHEHQRDVLERCTAPFVLWARLAAAACDPPILEEVDEVLGSQRPLSAALDRLATDGDFRDCYRRWLDD